MQLGVGPSTRSARVEAAITRAVMLWQTLALKEFPSGMIIFASNEVLEVLHPVQPLHDRVLYCASSFDTSAVQEALRVRRELTYGVVAIDGDEATLGVVVSATGASKVEVSKVAHFSANIASRTRRGGQSATRYSRNRDGEELAFLRKVAQASLDAFGDVRGVLLGGRGDMKSKLLAEFSPSLRQATARMVDLACHAGVEGLQKVASHIGEVAKEGAQQVEEYAIGHFFELVDQTCKGTNIVVCYGEEETLAALKMGVVHQLLLASSYRGSLCSRAEMVKLAAASGSSLLEVSARSEATCRFCDSYKIAALLRHAVDPCLLEPDVEEAVDVETPCMYMSCSCAEVDGDSVSTDAPSSDNPLIQWLQEVLAKTMKDATVAESLAMCADLVLFDETTDLAERLENVVEMLWAEDVSEEVLLELSCHMADHLSMIQ